MLGQLAWRGFGFAYAVACLLGVVATAGIRDGAFTKRPSKERLKELQIAQKQIWSVELSPLPGFTHHFFTLRSGVKLHYVLKKNPVSKNAAGESGPQNVAVFIHGFPDSYMLWSKILQSSSLDSHILVAIDLPGYGGSEGLKRYDANEMLEAISEILLAIREQYLKEEARFVVVSHDWGSIITARLASEAPQLADRWIIASALIPGQTYSTATAKAASAKQMLHTYLRQPLRVSLLKNALNTVKPVYSQMRRSFYIFIFNLPYPLCNIFPTFGNYWFLRLLQKAAHGRVAPGKYRKLTPKEAAEAMASSIGPGAEQLETADAYAPALKSRVANNGMLEKMRIYREGLFLGTWEKSIEIVVALSELQSASPRGSRGSGAGLFDDGPSGALKAPATIIYGEEDPAFEKNLVLDGIGDYLTRDSQVVVLEKSGHWLPTEELGSSAITEATVWALEGEKQGLKEKLAGREGVVFRVAL